MRSFNLKTKARNASRGNDEGKKRETVRIRFLWFYQKDSIVIKVLARDKVTNCWEKTRHEPTCSIPPDRKLKRFQRFSFRFSAFVSGTKTRLPIWTANINRRNVNDMLFDINTREEWIQSEDRLINYYKRGQVILLYGTDAREGGCFKNTLNY